MNKDEYDAKLFKLNKDHRYRVFRLDIECAKSNNIVKAGDLVSDNNYTIIVEGSSLHHPYSSDGVPSFVYSGERRKKNGDPCKKSSREKVYQCNLTFVNSKPVEQL